MSNNSCILKSPATFHDFLTVLEGANEAPDNFRVLYRGQSNKKWKLNSTLARPITQVPQPFRRIVAYSELRGYFEQNRPSDELLEWEKKGPEPIYVLGKYLQQNPLGKKIKDKPDNKKILTPFMDFTVSPFVALFFANYHLQSLSEKIFHSSLERKTDGAIFIIHMNDSWIKKSFVEIVDFIVLHLKAKKLTPPIYWDPASDLNDLDDQKAKRQQAEYIIHTSLDLSLEAFACEDFRITKIILKNEWFNEASSYLTSNGFTVNYLFPGHVLADSM